MNTTKCRECGKPLIGRADKKYCHEGCRNEFNNRKNRVFYNRLRRTNRLLLRNYRILLAHDRQAGNLSRIELIELGFRFELFTGMSLDADGNFVRYVYDLGLKEISSDRFRIFKQEESMESPPTSTLELERRL